MPEWSKPDAEPRERRAFWWTQAAIGGLVLIMFALLWAATLTQIAHDRANTEAAARQQAADLARAFEARLVDRIERIDHALKHLRQEMMEEPGPVRGRLAGLRYHVDDPALINLMILDAEGRLVDSTAVHQQGTDYSDREYFRVHRDRPADGADALFISKPLLGRVSQLWVLLFTRRIEGPDGRFAGVLGIGIDPFKYADLAADLPVGREGAVSIVGMDRVFRMLHSGPAEGAALRALIGKEVPGERAYFDLARPATDVLRVPAALDSRGLILAYRRLAKFPLVANVSFTEAEVFAAAEERALFLRRSALAASAGILLCAFGLFLLRNGQHRTRMALIRANGLLRGNERVLEERVRDRTRALELSNQQVRELAYSDGVTGLPNRALLADRAEQAVQAARRYGRKLAFLFLDLDHFKTVNDTLGHQAGDQLLAAVALRLRAAVRMSDSVARMGGDEFVVMVEELEDSRDAAHTADRIMAALRTPFSLEGRELHVGVSIGIAMFPDDGADMPALLKNADTAMYAAKTAGRNALRFFSPAMTEAAERRLELESALRRAVAQADFTLVYQPKIYAATGQLCGVEALLRWHHPERGWVPPSEFIPLAEEIGLIEPLGAWVINEACRFIAGWDGQSLAALRVAVNVAAGQINRGDLGAVVERALKLHGIDPALLEIEVTESAVIADTARATATLNRLRALGVTVALDDFGTGYSSLVYLRRIDIDSIKIDRSFLTDVRPGSRDADLVRQIIRLAQSLRLSVVAEGVETAEHRSFLEEAGCDMLQGYHIARPMPAADLRDWLARRQDGRKAGEPLSRQPSQLARA